MRPGRVVCGRGGARSLAQSPPHTHPDYFLFSEVLMQRPVRLGRLWRSHLLSREEAAYMQAMAREHFEDIMAVLKALPRPMLLVLRNVNTVRAINTALGTPVDRYFLMAKRWVWPGRGGAGRGEPGWGGARLTSSLTARSEVGAAWQAKHSPVSTAPASGAMPGWSGRRSSLKWP